MVPSSHLTEHGNEVQVWNSSVPFYFVPETEHTVREHVVDFIEPLHVSATAFVN